MPSDEEQQKVEKLLSEARHPDASRNLLALLFPKLNAQLKVILPLTPEEEGERKRENRISQREFAQSYFGLTPDTLSWGRQELEEVLNVAPMEAMRKAEERVNAAAEKDQPRLRRQFLDALDGAFSSERPFTGEWLQALVDHSRLYLKASDPTQSLLHYVDNTQRFRRAIYAALNAMAPPVRGEVFEEAVTRASELSLLCAFFRTVVGDNNTYGVTNRDREYFGHQTEHIRSLLLGRVRSLSATTSFWLQASPGDLLWFWWGCNEEEVREFANKAIDDNVGFQSLLTVTVHRVLSTGGDYDAVSLEWSKIVDLDRLEERARQLVQLAASGLERQLADKFLAALKSGREDPFFANVRR